MAFSFGNTTTTQGSVFGAAAKPTFSFGGTSTATTTSTGFNFGTTTTSSGFGSFGTSSATPFGGLGNTATTTTTNSLFGGTGFGAAKPATGFGTTGFGTNTFGTGLFGTGSNTFASAAPTFGTNTLGSSNLNTGAFGTGTFGSGFGTKPSTGFGGFGLGTNQFGQQQQQQLQQQQQQQQAPATAHEALVAAVFNCCVFGDERDQVLAKWNLIQAQWGTGQAYYSRNHPPLTLTEQNPLCRFKAVGYSKLCEKEDKDGHVAMIFNKSEQEIKNNQQGLITSLQGLLGNKPNLAVNVDSVKAVADDKSQVVIYVVDKAANNSHVSASELANFLNAGNAKNALSSAGCSAVSAVTAPTPQMLQQYLQTPPPGMDIRLWKQAQADKPDSANYIPVPIIGFSEIKFLARLSAALHALRHTLLQIVARQEAVGRVGAALSPEEEATRARLHELASQLAAPPLSNGRLNELLCAVRLQRSASAGMAHERYQLDPGAQEDVKQFLTLQQKGMAHLLDTARKDLAALNTIAEGMSQLVRT